jgi:5-methylcytosine-specific restriction endonuclease McrA
MAPRPCLSCGQLIPRGSRCQSCHRTHRSIYAGAWAAISRAHRKAHPLCARCGSTTDLTVDHVVAGSLAGGIQTLCRPYNSKKRHGQ